MFYLLAKINILNQQKMSVFVHTVQFKKNKMSVYMQILW